MFGFFKNRKAIESAKIQIGKALHKQIKEALKNDEKTVTERVNSAFFVGYMYWFIRGGFASSMLDGAVLVDKLLEDICEGIIPNKMLYDIYTRQSVALDIAKSMNDQNAKMIGSNITPGAISELYEAGMSAGTEDARLLCTSTTPDKLRLYLLGQDCCVNLRA